MMFAVDDDDDDEDEEEEEELLDEELEELKVEGGVDAADATVRTDDEEDEVAAGAKTLVDDTTAVDRAAADELATAWIELEVTDAAAAVEKAVKGPAVALVEEEELSLVDEPRLVMEEEETAGIAADEETTVTGVACVVKIMV